MALVKLLAIFILIIVLLRFKIHLSYSMIISSVVLGLMFRLGFFSIARIFVTTSYESTTIRTAGILTLIMVLENIMRNRNMLSKIVISLKSLIGDYRVIMPILPAFMGLLPSAGGALFSAPLVEDTCEDDSISPERKSAINYWYRHIWECVLPLYPAVIITTEVLGVHLIDFIKVLYSFSIVAVVTGIPFITLGLKKPVKTSRSNNFKMSNHLIELCIGISPIVSILLLFFVFDIDLVYGLFIVIVALWLVYKYSWDQIKSSLKESVSLKIILLVLGVMLFKNMLEVTNIVTELPYVFERLGIPPVWVVILLPFLVGFLTGMSQAYAAITFPILVGLNGDMNLRLMALGFISGYGGIMISPMHFCLVLTVDYFKARLEKVIAMVLIPVAIMIGWGYLLYVL